MTGPTRMILVGDRAAFRVNAKDPSRQVTTS